MTRSALQSAFQWTTVLWSAGLTAALLAFALLSVHPPSVWRDSIDLYLGCLLLATILVPCLAAGETTHFRALLAAGTVIDTLAIVLLWTVLGGPVPWKAWLGCYAILAALLLAQWTWVRLLMRLIGPTLAAALVLLLSFAWLTWPIWLSMHLDARSRLLPWLVRFHPALAINALLGDTFGVWTEQSFAYRFTNLNQDLPYALPPFWWCLLGCALLSAPAILLWIRPPQPPPARLDAAHP